MVSQSSYWVITHRCAALLRQNLKMKWEKEAYGKALVLCQMFWSGLLACRSNNIRLDQASESIEVQFPFQCLAVYLHIENLMYSSLLGCLLALRQTSLSSQSWLIKQRPYFDQLFFFFHFVSQDESQAVNMCSHPQYSNISQNLFLMHIQR